MMMTSEESLSDFLEESEFADTTLAGDDLFAILESLEGGGEFKPLDHPAGSGGLGGNKRQKTTSFWRREGVEEEEEDENKKDGTMKVSHITVERNRRKQMNEHISVLRSLMPCFYVKRGDQASIIGGVVDYINELQQVLQSLEAKKQRKSYSEVLSPRVAAAAVQSPRPSPPVLSPRKPPLSPRPPPFNNLHHRRLHNHLAVLPISPRTPQPPGSPYKPYSPNTTPSSSCSSPCSSNNNTLMDGGVMNELVANSKSEVADVEVKFSGAANLVLKTVSCRIPGQAVKIVAALEDMSLEILQVDIKTVDDTTLVNSFTIKIGIECQLSAEELAEQIQQTFCNVPNS